MSSASRFETFTEARAHLKALFDAADRGHVATVRRDQRISAVVDGARLLATLMKARPANAEVLNEDGAWAVFLPGLPIAVEAIQLEDAIDETVAALREYADDWQVRLSAAPNHAENWSLVQLVALADDGQLRDWISGSA